MRRRTWIIGLVGLLTALDAAGWAEAGLFRRQARRTYTTPVVVNGGVVYQRTMTPQRTGLFRPYGPGSFGYNGDPPTPTNGYGYGQAAAGYGSAYPRTLWDPVPDDLTGGGGPPP